VLNHFNATRHPAQDRNPRADQPVKSGRGAYFPAAHHSRAGLCAVSTGGVSLFNAAVLADQNPHLRAHATKHGQQTDAANTCASREKFARVVGYAQAIPASPAAPFSISALVHGPLFDRAPVGTSATTESHI